MEIQRGYKTEIKPNNKQRTLLLKSAGAARWAYNWGLAQKQAARAEGRKTPTAIDLHRMLNAIKSTEVPWMYEVSKCAAQEALRNLDSAFKHFFRKCKLKKQGKFKGKVGYPKPKSKKKGIGSFRLTGSIKVSKDRIQLPKLGTLRIKERFSQKREQVRGRANYLPTNAKILSAVVSEQAGRWFVSVQVVEQLAALSAKPEAVVGVDLGIRSLATCSDGVVFENPKALRKNLKKLQRLGRQVSRKVKGSKNRKKAVRRLSKLHQRIGNIRKDSLHKSTSHLAKTKTVVVLEDLNVSGMLKNRRLARAIADVGLFEFRRQVTYKSELYGCEPVIVSRWFPSTKRCCKCHHVKEQMDLSEETFVCEHCGNTMPRDLNAAENLKQYYTDSLSEIYACGEPSADVAVGRRETQLVEAGNEQESSDPIFSQVL